ncbi:MAG: ATPase [Pseudomonadota bacterium]
MAPKYRTSSELHTAWQEDGVAVTLMGMSGVGKTTLARALSANGWFHYSGDYRIGTHHLQEAMVDNLKVEAMKVPHLRRLLREDLIYIGVNLDVDDIRIMSEYLGTIRDPENPDGLSIEEFRDRQDQYREAEIRSMLDVGRFVQKAKRVYGYRHFINDAGGSLCDIVDLSATGLRTDPVLKHLGKRTLIVHIEASPESRADLIRRSSDGPKPIYYRPEFLNAQLEPYMTHDAASGAATVDEKALPGRFQAIIFERLIGDRQSRYEAVASAWGCTISDRDAGELSELWLTNPQKKERAVLATEIEKRFLDLVADAIDRNEN